MWQSAWRRTTTGQMVGLGNAAPQCAWHQESVALVVYRGREEKLNRLNFSVIILKWVLKPWEWRILKTYLLALPQNSNLFWTYSFRTQILPFQVCALTYAPFLICLITATRSEQWNKWHGNFYLFNMHCNMHCILCGRPAPSLSKFPYVICLHEMWVFLALVKKQTNTCLSISLNGSLIVCSVNMNFKKARVSAYSA